MKYQVKFPSHSIENKFDKLFSKLPADIQEEIEKSVKDLADNPRPFGKKPFKRLKPPIQFYQMTAKYRIRIGNYRVLYDVDDKTRTAWILALRKRGEDTYR